MLFSELTIIEMSIILDSKIKQCHVKIEPRFEKSINGLLSTYFTKREFQNLNYFGQQ